MKSILSYFFNILKVKDKKIVFSNFNGKGYGCNPKYITEEFIRRNKGYDIVWLTKEDPAEFPKEVRVVKWGGLQAIYEWSTAKVIVNNVRMGGYFAKGFKKKREQIYIQTWHGSYGIKKMEGDTQLPASYIKKAKIDSQNIDYLLSNSKWMTKILKNCFWYNGEIIESGSPRNDILVRGMSEEQKVEIYKKVCISPLSQVLLYAPTFRDNDKRIYYEMDYQFLKEELSKKFGGDWVVLVRLHPAQRKRIIDKRIIDVSTYADFQELMYIANALITDYSSCAFDFILTKKPVFIYAQDYDDYKLSRGFYYPFDDTPFYVSKTFENLISSIRVFNHKEYTSKVNEFLRLKNSVDNGKASEIVSELCKKVLEGSKYA